jgi:hypothetical protein
MSRNAEALLEEFRKLSIGEQQELLQRLLHSLPSPAAQPHKPFPTIAVSGGAITAQQVAEALDDE